MANYFTQHHFSPRWSNAAHHDAPARHPAPESTRTTQAAPHDNQSNGGHHRQPSHMHDTVARFLQALNLHYGPEDYDVVHPHFDMVETKTCYAVYGELPGLGREDITVEANDHLFTLSISGELKRTAPQEASSTEATATTVVDPEGVGISHLKAKEPEPEPEAEPDASNTSKAAPPPAAQPGPEAWAGPGIQQPNPSTEVEETAAPTSTTTAQQPAATEETQPVATNPEETTTAKSDHKEKDEKDQVHWHVKERRIGHFKRVFRFPVGQVEMAGIKANLHHGLLRVIVPKRDDLDAYNKKVEEARKVDIFQGGPDQTYPLFGYFF